MVFMEEKISGCSIAIVRVLGFRVWDFRAPISPRSAD